MRIALIDHSYHKTTKSSEFFATLLSQIGSVHRFYDDSWCHGENAWRRGFDESDYDLVVIWQAYEAFSALSNTHDNVLFVPMYDAMLYGSKFYWKDGFASAKCLSFSRKLHQEVMHRGGLSRYFRYFPDPAQFATISDFDAVRAFFWYRTKKIKFDVVFDLCRDVEVETFTLHNAPDPGHALAKIISVPSNVAECKMTKWFDSADHYRDTLLKHNLFFVPRPIEGIGMSFLEAMACGLCVVAPNAPTMNEYISDGTNGLLYATERRFPLDLSQIKEIGARARETVERGFADWQAQNSELIDFIATPKSRLWSRRSTYLHANGPARDKDRDHVVAKRPWRSRDEFNEAIAASSLQPRDDVLAASGGKISVVTVCLDAAEVLETTIASVLNQDLPEVEYIILDGGSTDRSLAIIEMYAEHLAFWQSEPDKGTYCAMNNAVAHCTGEWILFMNAGDRFAGPDSLSRMFRHVPKDAEIVYGHHIHVRENGDEDYLPAAHFETTWRRLQRGQLWFDWLLGIPAPQATAIGRTLLTRLRYDTSYQVVAHHEMMFRAREEGVNFFNCDELISIDAGGRMSATHYQLLRREWIRLGRKLGDATSIGRFYKLLERPEAGNPLARLQRLLLKIFWSRRRRLRERAKRL